jgi:AcrR family transcriptional regulator
MSKSLDPLPSLRERQALQLRSEITRAAVERFLEVGFDGTTIDEIADDCGMSRRTVFRHYATKEDILLAWPLAEAQTLRVTIAARPATETPMRCLRAVLVDYAGTRLERLPRLVPIARLVQTTASLRARSHEVTDAWESALAEGLVARDPRDEVAVPLVVAVAMATARLGARRWLQAEANRPLSTFVDDAFDELSEIDLSPAADATR